MIKKIISWFNKSEQGLETSSKHKEALYKILIELYKFPLSVKELDREISAIVFNAKYHAYSDSQQRLPSDILSGYYQKARKGDESFLRDPFYRLLRTSKDIEAHKLVLNLKRFRR